MRSRRNQQYIAIRDDRGHFNYTRAIMKYDKVNKRNIRLYPDFVYKCELWKEHWDDIVGYDDPDHPFRLKDMIHFNNPEDIHPDFLQEATRQLTPIINERVGIELQKLEVMLEFSTGCTYYLNKYVYTKMGIVFYGNGSRFWIKWASLIDGQDYIPMSQSVCEKDIKFDICRTLEIKGRENPDFDLNGWIEDVRKVILPLKAKKPNYSYELQVAGLSWPDANFDLQFDSILSDEFLKTAEIRIAEFINNWNQREENNGQQGFIHNMLEVKRIDDESFEFLIDFGSTSKIAMLKFLDFLQEIYGEHLIKTIIS